MLLKHRVCSAEWTQCGPHRRPLPRQCQALREKTLTGVSSMAADPSASFSHISLFISSLLQPSKTEHAAPSLAPGLLPGCGFPWLTWMLMSWYLVKEISRSEARAGEWGLLSGAGGSLTIFLCRGRNMARSICPAPSVILGPTWAVAWSCRWPFFCGTSNHSIYRSEITQPAPSQPKPWQGRKASALHHCCLLCVQAVCLSVLQTSSLRLLGWEYQPFPSQTLKDFFPSPPRPLLVRIIKSGIKFCWPGKGPVPG